MEYLYSTGPYIHKVLIFDGYLHSWSACVRWVLIFMEYLYVMGAYIYGVLVFDVPRTVCEHFYFSV